MSECNSSDENLNDRVENVSEKCDVINVKCGVDVGCMSDRISSCSLSSNTSRKMQVVQILKSWNLHFSGCRSEEPVEFIQRLDECRCCMELSEVDVLEVLPGILSDSASRWYRLRRAEIKCWSEFRRLFRSRFFRNLGDEILLDEWKLMKQGEKQSVSEFLDKFRVFLEHFLEAPSIIVQVQQALSNLRPEYQHYFEGKVVSSLVELEELGMKFERLKEFDRCCNSPLPEEAMKVSGATLSSGVVERSAGSSSCNGLNVCSNGNSCLNVDGNVSVDSGISSPKRKRRKRRSRKERVNVEVDVDVNEVAECVSMSLDKTSMNVNVDEDDSLEGRIQGCVGSRVVRPFSLGPCFVCNLPGHRAAQCPQRICYSCLGMGHHAAECPAKRKSTCRSCRNIGSMLWCCSECESTKLDVDSYFRTDVWR